MCTTLSWDKLHYFANYESSRGPVTSNNTRKERLSVFTTTEGKQPVLKNSSSWGIFCFFVSFMKNLPVESCLVFDCKTHMKQVATKGAKQPPLKHFLSPQMQISRKSFPFKCKPEIKTVGCVTQLRTQVFYVVLYMIAFQQNVSRKGNPSSPDPLSSSQVTPLHRMSLVSSRASHLTFCVSHFRTTEPREKFISRCFVSFDGPQQKNWRGPKCHETNFPSFAVLPHHAWTLFRI